MKFANRNSDLDRFTYEEETEDGTTERITKIRDLIDATLRNTQILRSNPSNKRELVGSIKYANKEKKRRKTEPYTGSDNRILDIIEILEGGLDEDEDFEPIQFQKRSWELVNEIYEASNDSTEASVGLFTAPTGLGKTECFLGPLLRDLLVGRQDTAILVYPRRALLEDQLSRILEYFDHVKNADHFEGPRYDTPLSVGVWYGGIPLNKNDVGTSSALSSSGSDIFRLTSCWCENDDGTNKPFFLNSKSGWYNVRCPDGHAFDDDEIVLHRNGIRNDTPNLILTTLESLELFSVKPNYDIVNAADTVVFDEVHLLDGMYGAHASQIIRNVKKIVADEEGESPLFLGASATLESPKRFARKLFDVPESQIRVESPRADIDYEPSGDLEHYYFLLSDEDAALASTYIQQHMMLGHAQLAKNGTRRKILSFIDSISQVNQRHTQFRDADANNKLYELHDHTQSDVVGEAESWNALARKTGHDWIDEPIDVEKIYSGSGTSAQRIVNNDLILTTGYLEVGIDVPDIKFITQYRTPWDLASFVQRAGRAARTKNTEPHIVTFLSQQTGDQNLFYRADRFLESDVTTPLNEENEIVKWIHDRFLSFYTLSKRALVSNATQSESEEQFLEEFLGDELQLPAFHEFLSEPEPVAEDLLEATDYSLGPLKDAENVEGLGKDLDDEKERIEKSIRPILQFVDLSGDQALLQEDPFRRLMDELLEKGETVVSQLQRRLDGIDDSVEGVASVDAKLDNVSDQLRDVQEDEVSPSRGFKRVAIYLQQAAGDLALLEMEVDSDEFTLSTRELDNFREAVESLDRIDDEFVRQTADRRKQIYYVRQALDELESYASTNYAFASLWAVKHLMRAAYFFDRYRTEVDDEPASDGRLYYVPQSYFNDSGQSFTLRWGDGEEREESITALLRKYAPYNSEYMEDGRNMLVFQPDVVEDEDGSKRFDYESKVNADLRNDLQLQMPQSVEADEIIDRSYEQGLGVAAYCPECYELLKSGLNECPTHGEREFGNIHSDPIIETDISDAMEVDSEGDLSIVAGNGSVYLDAVKLDVVPAYYYDDRFHLHSSKKETVTITSDRPPIGFTLETRSIVWEIESLIDEVWTEDVREKVARFKDDVSAKTPYYTAAHLLLLTVADASGTNPHQLFYGVDGLDDDADDRVYVFEQTEGGQGIVDLLVEMLQDGNERVRESLLRLGYDVQFEAERLWADKEAYTELKDAFERYRADELDEHERDDEVKGIVRGRGPTDEELVVDRLREEVLSIEGEVQALTENPWIDWETAMDIKHELSKDVVTGDCRRPGETDAETDPLGCLPPRLGNAIQNQEEVIERFIPVAVDGCTNNLQIANPLVVEDQSDVLSYHVLERIREEVLRRIDDEGSYQVFGSRVP